MSTQKTLVKSLYCLTTLFVLFASSGATCIGRRPTVNFQPPVAFQNAPDAYAIAGQLNKSRNIHQLQSNSVTINASGAPPMSATVAWQRSHRFRMKANLGILGEAMDLGSNEHEFWMASRQGPQPEMFFARHDQFEMQRVRQVLPVSPLWLIEAIGIVELDPNSIQQPIQSRADGTLEVATILPAGDVYHYRTLIIDPRSGVVKQIFLRDGNGRMLATSTLTNHEYYQAVDYSLPKNVVVQLLPEGGEPLELNLTFGNHRLNDLEGDNTTRWTMPDNRGFNVHDLVQLGTGQPTAVTPQGYQPAY